MGKLLKNIFLIFLTACSLIVFACTKENEEENVDNIEPGIKNVVEGIRISWDYSSMIRIAPKADRPPGYYGYSRMIQLKDKRLACVYEASPGNIELTFSSDLGENWSNPNTIFQIQNNIAMAVPEIIELNDNSILVACNPRPRKPFTNDRKFGIKVRKSTDGGKNWQPEQIIYKAKTTFEDGCWEPAFIQLPNGEVQLFFANEGIYTTSTEQNISMLKSTDLGESWNDEPTIVGFRNDRRDGMPVPLLLADKGELLVAIEDNKIGEFKPAIYRETIIDNWSDGLIS